MEAAYEQRCSAGQQALCYDLGNSSNGALGMKREDQPGAWGAAPSATTHHHSRLEGRARLAELLRQPDDPAVVQPTQGRAT
jgi:hypothetical protein